MSDSAIFTMLWSFAGYLFCGVLTMIYAGEWHDEPDDALPVIVALWPVYLITLYREHK